MKKFVFLYQGQGEAITDSMKAWGDWFARVGEHMVDSGNPFGAGRQITPDGVSDLSDDVAPITGYSIVSAADLDAAEKLLDGCPMSTGVRIYEAMPM
jgi:hypothetical protein